MASWIPIRNNLHESPRTVQVARILEVDKFTVVGMMVRVWSWVGDHTPDGVISDITPEEFDEVVGVAGLGQAMLRSGWMKRSGGDLLFPEWEQWNGQCSKRRLSDARRKQLKRKVK
jgi:hypothetical protein